MPRYFVSSCRAGRIANGFLRVSVRFGRIEASLGGQSVAAIVEPRGDGAKRALLPTLVIRSIEISFSRCFLLGFALSNVFGRESIRHRKVAILLQFKNNRKDEMIF